MTYDFTSFSIVFESNQDNGRLIMKGNAVCNGAPSTVEKILPAGIKLGLLDQ